MDVKKRESQKNPKKLCLVVCKREKIHKHIRKYLCCSSPGVTEHDMTLYWKEIRKNETRKNKKILLIEEESRETLRN